MIDIKLTLADEILAARAGLERTEYSNVMAMFIHLPSQMLAIILPISWQHQVRWRVK